MRHELEPETLIEQKVTYSLELEGRFILVENVPARVNVETGERFFAPETVERLHSIFKFFWLDKARGVGSPRIG